MEFNIFVFVVDEVCSCENGFSVVGRMKNGELKVGDEVHLVAKDADPKFVRCEHILKNNREIIRARKGESLVLTLSGVTEQDVKKGMYLSTPNYRVRFD
jgi:translation elongation factor EF-Tu-like GTPase